jgi:hypothetical protein
VGFGEGLVLKRVDVELQLIAIVQEAHTDNEAASVRERRLFRDVLMHIAHNGDGQSVDLARATLRAWELQFPRTIP